MHVWVSPEANLVQNKEKLLETHFYCINFQDWIQPQLEKLWNICICYQKDNVSYFSSHSLLIIIININCFLKDTIIFSIHQPGHSIFKLFDKILLMCKGKSIYHDAPEKALSYFAKQGYVLDQQQSTADFLLDILIRVGRRPEDLKVLNKVYKQSSMQTDIDRFYEECNHRNIEISHRIQQRKKTARSCLVEVYYILQRTLRNGFRDPALFLSQMIISVLLGILMGLVFHNMERTPDIGVRNRLGAIFFISSSQALCSASAIGSLLQERSLFIHVSL